MDRRTLFALGPALALAAGAAVAQTPPATPTETSPLFPDDDQFWFETVRMFGADEYGAGSFGEVLAVSRQIKAGDYDSWYDAWNAAGDRLAKEAEGQLVRSHKVSARDNFLRASNAYRSSEFFLHANPKDPRVSRAYKRAVETYQAAVKLWPTPIEPVEIPYEGTTLPGYLHRVDGSAKRRPLLLLNTGFDGSAEEMHWSGATAAVERGYNVLVFDGPGQFGPLHRAGLPFRPDWEKVVTPVVDFALKQKGVDPKRIALMGVSMGGYLAPRAAAFEPRLAACIANDGVFDNGAPYLAQVPPAQRQAFLAMIKAPPGPSPLDPILTGMMKASPVARWAVTHGMWAFGASNPRAYFAKALEYNLSGGVAEKIRCPTLVCDADGDLFYKGQPQVLYDHLTCKKTMVRFTEAEGAGAHCQVGASRLAFARIYDWLDETLAAIPA
ncbi:alpha/beta fold hydrolase [Phenylobacterium sp.]|uniref:alpha/beta hydrolase family protein n=1 Tax=Phenylobacterium sp. TaxID=1871053 RepID=UPI001213C425|nr:alpha/beta fold hydrolase [Phenylobacterium sp.]THD61853.1 MAG: alpha/beta hydrolase [Phenylobacterium sp.]